MNESSKHALSDVTIVDADVHLTEGRDPSVIKQYLDEPFRGAMDRIGGVDYIWDSSMGGRIEEKALDSAEQVRRDLCDQFYIDYPILNSLGMVSKYPQSDLAVNLMQAYNNLLLDRYLDEDEDFFGLIELATQKPDKAAEEIDRLGSEKQVVGAFISNTGAYPPLGDPSYDVMYRALEDNDLAVVYHASAGGAFKYEFPRQNQGFESFFGIHNLAHLWTQSMTITSLMEHGTPEKFPDLNFVILEAGIGWVPYMLFRLNKEYSMRADEVPLLEKSPEEYIRDSFYFATQPIGEPNQPEHMSELINMIHAENLLFATDYPHWDFDHPDAVDDFLRRYFDDNDRVQVLGESASTAFDLNI